MRPRRRSFVRRPTREFSSEGSELSQVNLWRKAPGAPTTCSDALKAYASLDTADAIIHLRSDPKGLTYEEAARRLKITGPNILSTKKSPTKLLLLLLATANPFNAMLAVIAIISAAIPPPQWATLGTIAAMVIISIAIRYWQELRSTVAAARLQAGLLTQLRVRRQCEGHGPETFVIDEKTLVQGDVLLLNPGDAVPADCLVIQSSNLSVGKSEAQRKTSASQGEKIDGTLFDLENIVFMGTHVISESGLALVLRTGDETFIATITKELNKKRPENIFQKSIRHVGFMMAAFMVAMFPLVFGINGRVTGNWREAALFSITVAVGLVPEMFPTIVNANLCRGAIALSKKMAIVKCLESIQNLGAMTILCSDKTGTLTKDEIALRHYIDNSGDQNSPVFEVAYINAVNQSGQGNGIHSAIIRFKAPEKEITTSDKVGELPFTFETRRSSCIIRTHTGQLTLICKGAFEEVYSLCTSLRLDDHVVSFDAQIRREICQRAAIFNSEGYRVILVATRIVGDRELANSAELEGLDSSMVLEGLLTFLDPPKYDAKDSIAQLQTPGIDIKILTGDNLGVAMKVCWSLDIVKEIDEENIPAITGQDLARFNGQAFEGVVKNCKVFAKLTPNQKGQVILCLKKQVEVLGMLGDGINDCLALRDADARISIDTRANAAKDCADVILTKKELSIIVDCVRLGRVTQGNTIKYTTYLRK